MESQIKITLVQVFPIKESHGGKLKAFARVCLADSLQLTGLRVYEGTHGLFVSYPNDPNYAGEDYKQIFYPVTRELRTHIEETILTEYFREIAEGL
mgnify:CR=1 FL=1|tara:strand:- start:9647 stop:9934 length:288 start_codon:yes stop_codon:yes gene_type:complete